MKLRAHAKVNRSLSVLGVRDDGYHELKTVFQSLALHDTLHFEPADRLRLSCAVAGVPLDERNLVWKAAKLVWAAAGREGAPAGHARIVKRIPAQGGLGGGSADGAAALVGWNQMWGTGLTGPELAGLAPRLGADVPFFFCGGTALGLRRGDEIQPLPDPPARWVVLVFPPFGVSTPEAFRWWDEDRSAGLEAGGSGLHSGGASLQAGPASGFGPHSGAASLQAGPAGGSGLHSGGASLQAGPAGGFGLHPGGASLQTGPAGGFGLHPGGASLQTGPAGGFGGNDLELPVSRRHPEIAEIRRLLEASGAEAAAMTGSGSTVFGLFASEDAAISASASMAAGAGWRTLLTRTASRCEARLV